ncbi:MAG: putative deacetylase [Algoriphagus sp.]|jgi:predicted deacetylase
MNNKFFLEVTVKDHLILHGFDENDKEVLEEFKFDKWSKKLIARERIQSISEKYILMSYAFERFIYWEYKEDYETLKSRLD